MISISQSSSSRSSLSSLLSSSSYSVIRSSSCSLLFTSCIFNHSSSLISLLFLFKINSLSSLISKNDKSKLQLIPSTCFFKTKNSNICLSSL